MNAHLGSLPYIHCQFNTETRATLSDAIMDPIEMFQKRSGADALPWESFQISALTSPSSNRHLMAASHNISEASLFSECVINV